MFQSCGCASPPATTPDNTVPYHTIPHGTPNTTVTWSFFKDRTLFPLFFNFYHHFHSFFGFPSIPLYLSSLWYILFEPVCILILSFVYLLHSQPDREFISKDAV
ncbi:uncharacterized protein ACHE_60826S [Aspergillus chevalieri]|uniref:Uncharacterized protein n=1 Tax=Aspergillus chevalieri TaxID=182096 RepID=A0A7R7VUL8_ASPCH|nr:uncharacterized protein ACHE_60826S [Aspergillus chevalieri]BCR90940.1 hypothetical protein ACHE_60826S [Aspergillus chevalieri]